MDVTKGIHESGIEKFIYLDGKFTDRVSDRTSWIIAEFGGKAVLTSARFFIHQHCGGSIRLAFKSTPSA